MSNSYERWALHWNSGVAEEKKGGGREEEEHTFISFFGVDNKFYFFIWGRATFFLCWSEEWQKTQVAAVNKSFRYATVCNYKKQVNRSHYFCFFVFVFIVTHFRFGIPDRTREWNKTLQPRTGFEYIYTGSTGRRAIQYSTEVLKKEFTRVQTLTLAHEHSFFPSPNISQMQELYQCGEKSGILV